MLTVGVLLDEFRKEILAEHKTDLDLREVIVLSREGTRDCSLGFFSVSERIG